MNDHKPSFNSAEIDGITDDRDCDEREIKVGEPQMGQQHDMNLDPELMAYMGKAMAALDEGSS